MSAQTERRSLDAMRLDAQQRQPQCCQDWCRQLATQRVCVLDYRLRQYHGIEPAGLMCADCAQHYQDDTMFQVVELEPDEIEALREEEVA